MGVRFGKSWFVWTIAMSTLYSYNRRLGLSPLHIVGELGRATRYGIMIVVPN